MRCPKFTGATYSNVDKMTPSLKCDDLWFGLDDVGEIKESHRMLDIHTFDMYLIGTAYTDIHNT